MTSQGTDSNNQHDPRPLSRPRNHQRTTKRRRHRRRQQARRRRWRRRYATHLLSINRYLNIHKPRATTSVFSRRTHIEWTTSPFQRRCNTTSFQAGRGLSGTPWWLCCALSEFPSPTREEPRPTHSSPWGKSALCVRGVDWTSDHTHTYTLACLYLCGGTRSNAQSSVSLSHWKSNDLSKRHELVNPLRCEDAWSPNTAWTLDRRSDTQALLHTEKVLRTIKLYTRRTQRTPAMCTASMWGDIKFPHESTILSSGDCLTASVGKFGNAVHVPGAQHLRGVLHGVWKHFTFRFCMGTWKAGILCERTMTEAVEDANKGAWLGNYQIKLASPHGRDNRIVSTLTENACWSQTTCFLLTFGVIEGRTGNNEGGFRDRDLWVSASRVALLLTMPNVYFFYLRKDWIWHEINE